MHRLLLLSLLVLLIAPAVQAQSLLHTLDPPSAPLTTLRLGSAVAGVPDVDGDGRGDVLVGANRAGVIPTSSGRVFLHSGKTGVLLHTLASPNGASQDFFGDAVAAVPDANGDGKPDLLVGAPGADPGASPSDAGRAYLFSGATGALLHTLASPNEQNDGQFGLAVAGVPDLDGDGRGDLLIGALESAQGLLASGRAYVFSGATGAHLGTLTSPNIQGRSEFGTALAGVPDVNGDGRGDLLIGARGEDDGFTDSAGRAYLFSGATGQRLRTLKSANPTIAGNFGNAVASVADMNGDGKPDLLVGARYENAAFPLLNIGRAYVFSGSTGERLHTLTAPTPQNNAFFGWSVAGVTDADGDGCGDLLIGSPSAAPGAAPNRAGRAYLFSGDTGNLIDTLVSPDEQPLGQFGYAVAGVPDTENNGRSDLFVGAVFETREGLDDGGNAYLFGSASPVPASIKSRGSRSIAASGGSIKYRITLGNPTAQNQAVEAWIVALLPNGEEYGLVRGPETVPLNADQTLGPFSFSETVPDIAPPGSYSLVLRVGAYPDGVLVSDALPFTKRADAEAPTASVMSLPEHATLESAYPNPFARQTTLAFRLPERDRVTLAVYDILGREVARPLDSEVEAGRHEAVLNGSDLPSGMYIVRLQTGNVTLTQRLTLVR